MKTITNCILFTFFIFFYSTATNAQVIDVALTSPIDTAGACESNLYKAIFIATGFHTINIQASLDLNGGVSTCGSSPIVPHAFIQFNQDSSTAIVSNIQLDTLTGTWQGEINISDTITIAYHIFVDCSVIPGGNSTNNIDLLQIWSDPTFSNTYNINSNGNLHTTLNLQYPFITDISNAPLPNTYYGSYLNIIDEKFMYINSGNISAHMRFRFLTDSTEYCGFMDNQDLTYSIGLYGTPSLFTSGSPITITLDPLDTLIIIQQAQIDTCLQSCIASAQFYWECDYGIPGQDIFCSKCQNIATSDYDIFNAFTDIIRMERITPIGARYDFSCYNDTSMYLWEYRITNAGTGALDSVFINLVNTDEAKYLTLIPVSSLQLTADCAGCIVTNGSTQRINALCDSVILDPLDLAWYVIKDFDVNDTLIFRFKTFRCSEENNLELLNKWKYFNHWKMNISAKTNCGNNVDIPHKQTPLLRGKLTPLNQVCFSC